jgi:protease I
MNDLSNRKVLMLATHGYEEAELFGPRQLLLDAGVHVILASSDKKAIRGVVWDDASKSSKTSEKTIEPDVLFSEVKPEAFDALVLPGGVTNPDMLRMDGEAIAIVRTFAESGKTVAAICHAPWLLIEANAVRGRRTTGWYSIRTDLTNAGSQVVDQEVVIDGNIITSRMPRWYANTRV